MRYEIKEMGIGEILDQAIQLTKNHFGLLFLITLVLLLPYTLLLNYYTLSIQPTPPSNPTPEQMIAFNQQFQRELMNKLPIFFGLLLLGLVIVFPVTNSAIIHAIASVYLHKPTSVGNAFARAFQVILPVIGTAVLMFLAVFAGMLLCVIPGILFALWFALWNYIVVVEGTAGTAALSRSKELMKGNIGTLLVLGLIVGVIQMLVGQVSAFIPHQHVQVAVSSFVQQMVGIFATAAFVVFYFSCRCKHENFDLALLAAGVQAEEADLSQDMLGETDFDETDRRRWES